MRGARIIRVIIVNGAVLVAGLLLLEIGFGNWLRPNRMNRLNMLRDATITYPGGLRARWRWGGSGQGAAVFALSEAGGSLEDLGPLVSPSYEQLCRAELRIDGPAGGWTVRLASTISDEPARDTGIKPCRMHTSLGISLTTSSSISNSSRLMVSTRYC